MRTCAPELEITPSKYTSGRGRGTKPVYVLLVLAL